MTWFEDYVRNFEYRPLLYPVFHSYYHFMNIKRGDKFPFYIFDGVKAGENIEDRIIDFCDYMVDAHELERNKGDKNRSFYQRSYYVWDNYLRYQNDTVANCMFDTKLAKPDYDYINSTMTVANSKFYALMTAVHMTGFMYMSYTFRLRRITFVPALMIAGAYSAFFSISNNLAYKVIVDRAAINQAKALGLQKHVQPVGAFKKRGLNYGHFLQ